MFTIPNHEPFMTTIGKLNFFRWALESNILEYMEAHEEEIRTGYNAYLKETMDKQKQRTWLIILFIVTLVLLLKYFPKAGYGLAIITLLVMLFRLRK